MRIEFTVFSTKKELTAAAGCRLLFFYIVSLVAGRLLAQGIFEDKQILVDWELHPTENIDTILYVIGNAIGKIIGGSLVFGFIFLHLRKVSTKVGCSALGIVKSNAYLCGSMFLLGLAMNVLIHFLIRPIFAVETTEISDAKVGINDINEWIRFLYIFELTAMAPVIEEFLFRGVLYNSFINSYRKIAAAIVTTFLFALMHFNVFLVGHWVDISYLFLISSSLLVVRELSGSLLPSIFMHSGANSASVFPFQFFT